MSASVLVRFERIQKCERPELCSNPKKNNTAREGKEEEEKMPNSYWVKFALRSKLTIIDRNNQNTLKLTRM